MIYKIIIYIGVGGFGISFLFSAVLFFKLRIARVIGDLTGISAKCEIRRIKKNNSNGTSDSFKRAQIDNAKFGNSTDKLSNFNNNEEGTLPHDNCDSTTVLSSESETIVLPKNGDEEIVYIHNIVITSSNDSI